MEEELCTYCGKPRRAHAPYPWDHEPIMVSEIIAEAIAERDKKAASPQHQVKKGELS